MSKKKHEVTPWFPLSLKPTMNGVYQIDWNDGDPFPCYSYWDGSIFNGGGSTAARAASRFEFGKSSLGHPARWRGLAQDPNKA